MSSVVDEPRAVRSDPVATLHDSLASLCRSGVPLPRAFGVLAHDLGRGPLRDAMAGLATDLEDGVPFQDAYARRCHALPAAYAALVSAGMAAGDLPGALAEIARHAERRARTTRTLRRALAGPLTSATFVLVVGALLLALVGPRFRDIEQFLEPLLGAPSIGLPVVQAGLHSRMVVAGAALALLALTIGGAFVFAWFRSPLDGRAGVSSLGLRWPVLGRIRLYAGLSGALTTLASLVRRGVPLPEALDLVAQTAEEHGLRRNLVTMAAAAHDGSGLEQAVREAGLLPPSELWLIRAAQERGSPEEALDDLAVHYTDRLERTISRTISVIVPAAEIAVGAVVFILAYTFVVPVTEMAIHVLGAF